MEPLRVFMDPVFMDPACWSWPVPDPRPLDDLTEQVIAESSLARAPFEALQLSWDFHAGRCAICGERPRKRVADHCHWTGLQRGRLCPGCNVREAARWFDDTIYGKYRLRPPTVILGYATPYINAKPEGWVVAILGPRPDDPAEAAAYLAASARLPPPGVDDATGVLMTS